jgi:uncharacterized membrane protein YgcG
MAPSYKPVPTKPFIKGMNAATDPYTQPPGTFPRGSNFLLNKRGGLDVCDGSQLVHAFNGAVQASRGKAMCDFLFTPTGVPSYYLSLMKALDIALGPPQNLTVVTAAGGTLPAATYFYKVTAIDGVGGETTVSSEASVATGANGKNTLTWNIVPNAFQYNVYRSTVTNTETLLSGTNVPVAQAAPGNLTVSYVDDGTATTAPVNLVAAPNGITKLPNNVAIASSLIQFTTQTAFNLAPGEQTQAAGVTNATFNGFYTVVSIISPTVFIGGTNNAGVNALAVGTQSGGGTVSAGVPPAGDNTQQIALFQMPVIVGSPAILPASYNNANIVALFPANLVVGGGASGASGSTGGGGGGSGGGGGTGGGGGGGGGLGGGGRIR